MCKISGGYLRYGDPETPQDDKEMVELLLRLYVLDIRHRFSGFMSYSVFYIIPRVAGE